MESFKVKVQDRIFKTREEVFEAIVNPRQIVNYFVSESSGPLEAGKTIHWEWSDYNAKTDIEVLEVVHPAKIRFSWPLRDRITMVNIILEELEEGQCDIQVTEEDFRLDTEGVKTAMEQTQGWTDFVCSLKAYLYTGVNIRKGT